jgi:hypothetical protein
MAIDHVGSMVNLAKQMKLDLTGVGERTEVQTATLRLLLDTLIEVGTPNIQKLQVDAARTVAQMIEGFNGR